MQYPLEKEIYMKTLNFLPTFNNKRSSLAFIVSVAVVAFFFAAEAMAFGQTQGKVNTFFTNINTILRVASIAIVTIAIIFAGYQIAFANKRITDVLPILVGGLLIGAAAEIARMLLA
jgi:type IV secretion system protein VirB2